MYHKYIMLRMEVPTCIRSEVEWVQMKSQAWKFSMCTRKTRQCDVGTADFVKK